MSKAGAGLSSRVPHFPLPNRGGSKTKEISMKNIGGGGGGVKRRKFFLKKWGGGGDEEG